MKKEKYSSGVHPIHKLLSMNIIRLRKKAGITQLELAQRTRLTHNFINDLENGKKGVSAESIVKLCKALNTEPYQLYMPVDFNRNEVQNGLKDSIEKMYVLVNELNIIKDKSIFLEE